MKYRQIGKTDIKVSEIAFGAEWMVEKTDDEVKEIVQHCEDAGINFLDCWMSDPKVRSSLGEAISPNRENWYIQGHIGSTWQNNQYVRTRDMDKVKPAFEDLLKRLKTDYIDFGMIHFVDEVTEYHEIMDGEFIEYVRKLKDENIIHHIGLSSHNPDVAKLAANNPEIELVMVSSNPAFDMMPPTEDINMYFDKEKYTNDLAGLQPEKQELYDLCEETDTAITIMKGFAGGRLFSEEESPFGVTLTPVQCIHYALEIPSSKAIFVGIKDIKELDESLEYETASDEEKDYSSILTKAPKHSYLGQCTYCGHCAPCPVEINVALVNKYYDLARIHDEIPDSIKEHYTNLKAHASDCIECGQCEERCPFNVDVISIMHKANELFKN